MLDNLIRIRDIGAGQPETPPGEVPATQGMTNSRAAKAAFLLLKVEVSDVQTS